MSYGNVKTVTTLNPEYFRLEALAYNSNPTDRKQWLERQIINLQAALNKYAVEMQALIEQGAKLDGQSDVGMWMQKIGGVALVIPSGWGQVAGAVLTVAGTILGALDRKKDNKTLQALQGKARQIQLEVMQIQSYYDNYTAELQKIQLLPIALFATAAYLISK